MMTELNKIGTPGQIEQMKTDTIERVSERIDLGTYQNSPHIAFEKDGDVILVNLEDDEYFQRFQTPGEFVEFLGQLNQAANKAFRMDFRLVWTTKEAKP